MTPNSMASTALTAKRSQVRRRARAQAIAGVGVTLCHVFADMHGTPPAALIAAYYVATAARSDESLATDAALLDAAERARWNRLMFAPDRRDFAAAHALHRALGPERSLH
jgi:hypothetical protein